MGKTKIKKGDFIKYEFGNANEVIDFFINDTRTFCESFEHNTKILDDGTIAFEIIPTGEDGTLGIEISLGEYFVLKEGVYSEQEFIDAFEVVEETEEKKTKLFKNDFIKFTGKNIKDVIEFLLFDVGKGFGKYNRVSEISEEFISLEKTYTDLSKENFGISREYFIAEDGQVYTEKEFNELFFIQEQLSTAEIKKENYSLEMTYDGKNEEEMLTFLKVFTGNECTVYSKGYEFEEDKRINNICLECDKQIFSNSLSGKIEEGDRIKINMPDGFAYIYARVKLVDEIQPATEAYDTKKLVPIKEHTHMHIHKDIQNIEIENKEKSVVVLGTKYTIESFDTPRADILWKTESYCNFKEKKIMLYKNDADFQNLLVRAFLYESGINKTEWANNEQIIEWISVQYSKIALAADSFQ